MTKKTTELGEAYLTMYSIQTQLSVYGKNDRAIEPADAIEMSEKLAHAFGVYESTVREIKKLVAKESI